MVSLTILGVSLLLSLSPQQASGPVLAVEPLDRGRPCLQADLVGVWTSSRLAVAAPAGTEPPVLGTDYMRFAADGEMVYLASRRPLVDLSEIERALETMAGAMQLDFRAIIREPGMLIITRGGTPVEGFTCTVISESDATAEVLWTQLRGLPPVMRRNVRHRR
jgi:hypothetical protein